MRRMSDEWKNWILMILCAAVFALAFPTETANAEDSAWTLENVIPSGTVPMTEEILPAENEQGAGTDGQKTEEGEEQEDYDEAEREWYENGYDDPVEWYEEEYNEEEAPGTDDETEINEPPVNENDGFFPAEGAELPAGDEILTETISARQAAAEDDGSATPEELLTAYAEKVMNGAVSAAGRLQLRNDALNTGNRLEGIDRAIYNKLKAQITQVASGAITYTALTVPAENLGFSKTEWTAEDLGLDTLVEKNSEGKYQYTEEAKAIVRMNMAFDLKLVLSALLADCPYELYWFDKTEGIIPSYRISGTRTKIGVTDIVFYCAVAMDYRTGDAVTVNYEDEYGNPREAEIYLNINGEDGRTVTDAAANAAAIIRKYADLPDLEKLQAYGNEICALTGYNMEAAYDSSTPYGNPWQLIWVFDGNDSSTVVCEGYSKAFQYLCDHSSFQNGIVCYSVTGKLNKSEEHMWNIVRMEDGLNYLVDLTNADSGDGMSGELFLVGSEDGDGTTGYTITNDTGSVEMHYLYSRSALNLYTTAELTLAPRDYGSYEPHEHAPGEPVRENETEASCSEEGSYDEVVYCTACGEELSRETFSIPKLPHSPGEPELENEVPATYTAEGHYDEVIYCTECGEELSRIRVTVKRLDIPVPEISDLTAVKGGIRVRWSGSEDTEQYRVWRTGPQDDDWILLTETKNLYYTDTDVTDGESYCYRITAVIGERESEASGEQELLYRETVKPTPPPSPGPDPSPEPEPDPSPDPEPEPEPGPSGRAAPTTGDTAQPERLTILLALSLSAMLMTVKYGKRKKSGAAMR